MDRMRSVFLVVLLALTGCFDPVVDATRPIVCDDGSDCPGGLVCNVFTARCVDADAPDVREPRLVGEASLAPQSGPPGTRFTARFVLDADVLGDPAVVVDVADRTIPFTLDGATDRLARTWVFSWQPDTSVPLGRLTVRAGFIATDGVPAVPLILGSVTIVDPPPPPAPTAPALVGSAAVTPVLGDGQDPFVVAFTLDGDVEQDPIVTIDGNDGIPVPFVVDSTATDRGARRWVYALQAHSGVADGARTIRGRWRAPGGDVDVDVDLGRFTLDRTGPLVAVGLEPALLGVGGRSRLSVIVDEPLGGAPTLVFRDGVDPGFVLVTNTETLLVYEVTTSCFDLGCTPADGRYLLDEIRVEDVAGTETRVRLNDVGLTVDTRAPRIVSLTTARLRVSEVDGFNNIDVSFVVDEPVRTGQATVRLDDLVLDCTTTAEGRGSRLQCGGTVAPGLVDEGDRVVLVTVTDDAGNAGVQSAPIVVDFTPPLVVPGSGLVEARVPVGSLPLAVSTVLTPGTTVTVSFTADEALFAAPVVEAVPVGTALDLPGLPTVALPSIELLGQRLARHRQVLASTVPGGAYEVRTTMTDLVGHRSTLRVGVGFDFVSVVGSPCPAPTCIDVDGDGQVGFSDTCAGIDCDDTNPAVFVGAPEFPGDGLDNDCRGDGDAPVDETTGWFFDDTAQDGLGTRASPSRFIPAGTTVVFVTGSTGSALTVPSDEAVIVGGFDRATWTRRPGDRTFLFFNGPSPRGILGIEVQADLSETVVVDSGVGGFVDDCVIVGSDSGRFNVLGMTGGRLIDGDFSTVQIDAVAPLIRVRVNLLGVLSTGTSTIVNSAIDGIVNDGVMTVLHSRVGSNEIRTAAIEGSGIHIVENTLLRAATASMAGFAVPPQTFRQIALQGTSFITPQTPLSGPNGFVVDDPGVVDGVHILPTSPLVDRGLTVAGPLGVATADIDGDCRTGVPDIGPDEVR